MFRIIEFFIIKKFYLYLYELTKSINLKNALKLSLSIMSILFAIMFVYTMRCIILYFIYYCESEADSK